MRCIRAKPGSLMDISDFSTFLVPHTGMILRNIVRCCALSSTRTPQRLGTQQHSRSTLKRQFAIPLANLPLRRHYVSKSAADAAVEELQELYATAKDEVYSLLSSVMCYSAQRTDFVQFEIAQEETEKKTVYAEDDRAAAKEELAKLKEAFDAAVNQAENDDIGKEIARRVGQRVRELERAVEAMEEMAMED